MKKSTSIMSFFIGIPLGFVGSMYFTTEAKDKTVILLVVLYLLCLAILNIWSAIEDYKIYKKGDING